MIWCHNMINKNDLYDIAYALILIRSDIRAKTNVAVLEQIIKVLESENSAEDNQIRKAISSIEGLDGERWYFVFYNNVYVNHKLLKKAESYSLLINLMQNLVCELEKCHFEKAYDLVDCVHCLPEMIADNNFTIPKSFWRTFVKSYRNKWDREFLRFEQKRL